jgi:antitoxin (DNA-binding transcriptional repressor) of toxin-antitoxin stability system
MRAVNIRELKNNPSEALRSAREDDLVVVMNRDHPQALLVDLTRLKLPDVASVNVALAVALFGQGNVSLGYAARIAGKSLSDMMEMLTHMGVPIVKVSSMDIEHDLATLDAWKNRIPA